MLLLTSNLVTRTGCVKYTLNNSRDVSPKKMSEKLPINVCPKMIAFMSNSHLVCFNKPFCSMNGGRYWIEM